MAHNKRELKTGGGINTQVVFTRQDEEVIQLVSLRDAVDRLTNVNKFGVPRKRTIYGANKENVEIENLPTGDELIDSPSAIFNNDLEIDRNMKTNTEVSQIKGPKQLKLLEKQINIQQKLYNNINKFSDTQYKQWEELNSNQRKIYRAVEKLNEAQKKLMIY